MGAAPGASNPAPCHQAKQPTAPGGLQSGTSLGSQRAREGSGHAELCHSRDVAWQIRWQEGEQPPLLLLRASWLHLSLSRGSLV